MVSLIMKRSKGLLHSLCSWARLFLTHSQLRCQLLRVRLLECNLPFMQLVHYRKSAYFWPNAATWALCTDTVARIADSEGNSKNCGTSGPSGRTKIIEALLFLIKSATLPVSSGRDVYFWALVEKHKLEPSKFVSVSVDFLPSHPLYSLQLVQIHKIGILTICSHMTWRR